MTPDGWLIAFTVFVVVLEIAGAWAMWERE